MSAWIQYVLCAFYVALIGSCLLEHKLAWALYWLGALSINVAILWVNATAVRP